MGMTNNAASGSSSARLGTSILPTGVSSVSVNKHEEISSQVVHTTSSKKGKDLFKRMAEKRQEEEISTTEMSSSTNLSSQESSTISSPLLPGVDFEEIED